MTCFSHWVMPPLRREFRVACLGVIRLYKSSCHSGAHRDIFEAVDFLSYPGCRCFVTVKSNGQAN